MNTVCLVGNLTKDPVTFAQVTKITLAIDNTNESCSYIDVSLFGQAKAFADKYLSKGRLVAVEGKLSAGSYKGKDGKKHYVMDVIGFKLTALDAMKKDSKKTVEPNTEPIITENADSTSEKEKKEEEEVDPESVPF